MTLKKGDKAPSFKLVTSDKKEVKLEDFAGKNLILHFYPAAFTSTCTTQLCTVRDAISLYQNDKADVIGISVDMPFTLAKFKEAQNLNFTLASDFNKEAMTAYGTMYDVWILGLKGVAKRAAFVIDGTGTIQYAEVLENASELPNFQAINETLASLGVSASAN